MWVEINNNARLSRAFSIHEIYENRYQLRKVLDKQWQFTRFLHAAALIFVVLMRVGKHSIKNVFKANQSAAHAHASDSLCYVSNVSTIQLSPDICESDLAKATNEAFFFHSEMNYNKQFVISNLPRKPAGWVGFIVEHFRYSCPKIYVY